MSVLTRTFTKLLMILALMGATLLHVEARDLDGVSIDLPETLNYLGAQEQGPMTMRMLQGPKDANGQALAMIIQLIDFDKIPVPPDTPPEDMDLPSVADFHARMLNGIKGRRTDWKETKSTLKTTHNGEIACISWTAKSAEDGKAMHGHTWCFKSGKQYWFIQVQDIVREDSSLLDSCAAAVKTLKVK